MKREPQFTPIDLHTWKRGQMFYYFAKMAPTGYSLTVKVDVTRMKAALDEAKLKFFPAYLWLVTKTLNAQQEFRMAEKDGQTGCYDYLNPLYASFHEDDQTFSLMWTEYDEDFQAFYHEYLYNQEQYGRNHGVLCQPQMPPPPNAYTVSCVPWIAFEHFAVHSRENKPYYFPSVEAGKFTLENGRLMMSLSITCHHAAADGWHVKCFLEQLQADADRFEQYLKRCPPMEFHEKLQFLRKQQNWTQEQLAEKLYVSRTAVSKWELGKGYPNIESLKQLAKVFEVTIDELLSGEELMEAAQQENRSNLRSVYAALWGVLDAAALACVFLPLYGVPADGGVRSVNLFFFTAASAAICVLYWLLLIALAATGIAELWLARCGRAGCPTLSLAMSTAAILFFAAVREPYAAPLLFLLFLGKLFLLMKQNPRKKPPTR